MSPLAMIRPAGRIACAHSTRPWARSGTGPTNQADRKFGAHVFDPANGGAILWQHLFWFFGHPEVYIIALPFFGIVSEVIPVFSRKPMFGYQSLVAATIAIAGLSVTVWAHPHFHYVVFGTVVFAMFAGFHSWWPKMTGKMLDERLGKICFWLLFIGFHTTFLVQHWLGAEGMPRRYATYLPSDGFTTLNVISTIGSYILGASWATSCPPPRHNFLTLPRIRSESPAFELHHPA
ncbi:heme/copper-type cytochrome/quinol oxidase subunit 1, partial [Streptacidiphilus sp. BW17]